MIPDIPSYHHFSPAQIEKLSFHVTLRCVRNGGCGISDRTNELVLTKDIGWKENICGPSEVGASDECQLCLFTYTSADIIPYSEIPSNNSKGEIQKDDSLRGFTLKKDVQNHPAAKRSHRAEANDRPFREDPCDIMVIMAAIRAGSSSAGFHNEALCIIKLYQSGLVSACPAWSEVEAEDYDKNRVFMSGTGMDEIITKGPRVTTYSFCTAAGSLYEYTVESAGNKWVDDEEHLITEQQNVDREDSEKRRELIRKEFESFDCMYERDTDSDWDSQAHIEIVSASGFVEPNLLLCTPHGSNIVVRYRVLKLDRNSKKKETIMDGQTPTASTYSTVRGSLEFFSYFTVAFIGVAFALLLSLGNNGNDCSLAILLSIIPLVLITKAGVLGNTAAYHINHQCSLLYNECHENKQHTKRQDLVLELRAYLKHNFSVTSLAGCGTITLPSEPGSHDIEVHTWKPVACSSIGETRCRMYDFYLGMALTEIQPLDPVPTSDSEHEMVKDVDTRLFSKGGLLTDGSGSIHVRVSVMKNYFKDEKVDTDFCSAAEESRPRHRVKMRETVDEVLSRVRRNKRSRMSRLYNNSSDKLKHDSGASPSEETKSNSSPMSDIVSDRTKEVLTRVRSRKKNGS